MGQTLDAAYAPLLESLMRNRDPQVRGQALRVLIRIRREQAAGVPTAEMTLEGREAAEVPPGPMGPLPLVEVR
jgi:hypothetical protein